jgi:hypothetical protein
MVDLQAVVKCRAAAYELSHHVKEYVNHGDDPFNFLMYNTPLEDHCQHHVTLQAYHSWGCNAAQAPTRAQTRTQPPIKMHAS